MTELEAIASRIAAARDYSDVFGISKGGPPTKASLQRTYHTLAKAIHPDHFLSDDEKAQAGQTFVRLNMLHKAALGALLAGTYGLKPTAEIRTKRFGHTMSALLYRGEICDLYEATSTATGSTEKSTVVKVVRKSADNDLLAAESRALKRLRSVDGDEKFYPFFPELVDSFVSRKPGAAQRRGNVLAKLDGWYSLQEVRAVHNAGVNQLDMVWVYRKLLWLLGYVHQRGLIHGAVVPSHIMIWPEGHGVVLADWCYSTVKPDDDNPALAIKAVSGTFKSLYPPEVFAKESPTQGTDIYMAAQSMFYLLGGESTSSAGYSRIPKAFRAFFNGCSQANQRLRPQDAWKLLSEFDELLENLGSPYFPRRFRPFVMPAVSR